MLLKGVPMINICFEIDANGILVVSAEEKLLSGRNKNKITINDYKNRLHNWEIEKMVKEAEKYKKEDQENEKKEEAKELFKLYAYELRDSVSDLAIQGANKKTIVDAVKKALQWLSENQLAECSKYDDERKKLETLCNPISAKAKMRQLQAAGNIHDAARSSCRC